MSNSNALLVLFVGIPAFFMTLTTVVGRLERRLVWQYGDGTLAPYPPYPEATAAIAPWVAGAVDYGFRLLGWAADPRVPGYRTNYAVLLSPEQDCFVVACAGTIFKLPTKSVTIYTRTLEDRVYNTTNDQNGAQIDLLWPNQLAPVDTFAQLLARHRSLLVDKKLAVKPFTMGREIEEFRRLREERYETMARRGWIAYHDHSRVSWHFTLWGSLRNSLLNFPIGMIRAKTGGRKPRCV